MEIIGLVILAGISILVLGGINIVLVIRHSEDRNKLERLIKARDLREYELYSYQEPEEEEIESIEERFVPIEEIAEHIGKQK